MYLATHYLFDVLAWLALVLSSLFLYRRYFEQAVDSYSERLGRRYFIVVSLGGLTGAYFFGTLNILLSGGHELARSALGGLVGAIAAVEYYKSHHGVRGSTGAVFAVPLCIGLAIGRLGCFFAGLSDQTAGSPTELPVGFDFGDGIPRHPVQLYEAASMAVGAMVLTLGIWRRTDWAIKQGFYLAVGWYAAQRFFWEFLKPYGTVFGPLNLFHLLCLLLLAYALFMTVREPGTSHG